MEKSYKSFIESVFSLACVLLASFILFAHARLANAETAASENNVLAINWLSMEEMLVEQKKSPRPVMVDVYTDWCGWCKVMDEKTFSNAEVASYIQSHYYAVKLNAESERVLTFQGKTLTESELANAMRVSGYPTVVFLDEKLENISPVEGFRKARPFRRILENFVAGKEVD